MDANEVKLINEIRDHDLTKRKLERARDRVSELEMKQIPLEQQFEDWAEQNAFYKRCAAVWKRKAKWLRDDVRKCHGMANEINILTKAGRELEADNARLRQQLDNVRGLLPYWQRLAAEAEAHPQGKLIAAMHRGAVADVKMAMEADDEAPIENVA